MFLDLKIALFFFQRFYLIIYLKDREKERAEWHWGAEGEGEADTLLTPGLS